MQIRGTTHARVQHTRDSTECLCVCVCVSVRDTSNPKARPKSQVPQTLTRPRAQKTPQPPPPPSTAARPLPGIENKTTSHHIHRPKALIKSSVEYNTHKVLTQLACQQLFRTASPRYVHHAQQLVIMIIAVTLLWSRGNRHVCRTPNRCYRTQLGLAKGSGGEAVEEEWRKSYTVRMQHRAEAGSVHTRQKTSCHVRPGPW